VRIVLAYCSDLQADTDLTEPEQTRALVRAFVLPGILALGVTAASTTASAGADVVAGERGTDQTTDLFSSANQTNQTTTTTIKGAAQ
jgi:hypothetical protein